jgi:hypothetical protein
MKKLKLFNWLFLIAAFLMVFNASAQEKVYNYSNNWGNEGLTIEKQNNQSISFNFSITKFSTITSVIKGESLQNISLTGCFLPNDAGYPDLPGNGKYIAIPQGCTPKLKVVSYQVESIKDIDITPAFVIPADIDNRPLVYERNMEVYSNDAFYPANPVTISEPGDIRGVDVVMLGITPFQYNPVTKELLVYKDIKIEITFEGGNGHFGDDAFRSRWFDPILEDALFNYSSLPVIDYDKRLQEWGSSDATGCEYLIIIPNNPEFSQWGDSIKKFRTEQGIITNVVKLQDIPNSGTYAGIKTYITDGYNNWQIKPAACLLMGDYGINTTASTIDAILYPDPPYGNFPCDNYYGDVNGDEMPEIVMARMTVNNAAQLQVQCTKVLNYERNPPTDASFYNAPITALGWQTERWFQLCSEIVGGYWKTKGKTPVRINAIYSGTPGTVWSTATNTATIVAYFGPAAGGLNYIPATPAELGGWSGGTATMVNNAINAGAFMLQHRDHGAFTLWGEPAYSTSNVNSLTNVNNKLPFVFSINCQTGGFHYGGTPGSDCLAEKFVRWTYNGQNSGALGATGAAEVSYSFVNDVYAWGMYDNMFPDFMPAYGTTPASRGILPAFGNAAGKYFLQQSNWPYNTSNKQITYRLHTMFGDAFNVFYSQVPQNLTVSHLFTVPAGTTVFNVTATAGSFIALSVNGVVVGTGTGTGSSLPITLSAPLTSGSQMVVTVTLTNYKRYRGLVNVPVGITENIATDQNYTLMPNPSNGIFTVTSNVSGRYNVKVLNALNEVIYQENDVNSNISMNLSKYSSGVYYLMIENNKETIIKKFTIQK